MFLLLLSSYFSLLISFNGRGAFSLTQSVSSHPCYGYIIILAKSVCVFYDFRSLNTVKKNTTNKYSVTL